MYLNAFEEIVSRHKDKWAYIWGEQRTTYGELDHAARCIATGLRQCGVKPGDRVAVQMQSTINFAASCIAVWRVGGVVVPLDTGLPEAELVSLLGIAQVSILLAEEPTQSSLVGIRTLELGELMSHQPSSDSTPPMEGEDMLILFSSGTTGKPKGIIHTHGSVTEVAQRSVRVSGLTSNDVLLATSLSSTGFGLYAYVLEPLICGATVVVVHPFHPRVALEIAQQEQVTWIQTVPAVLKLLVLAATDKPLTQLRAIRLGAATLDEKSRGVCIDKFGILPIQGYGMSEVGRIACTTHSPVGNAEWMTLNTGLDARIFTDDGELAETGQIGEIGVRAISLCRPYYLLSEGTREPIPMLGEYFMSGDLGVMTQDGLLKLMGRRKSFILTPRYKVDPAEVEQVLLQHPEITDAVVVPAPGKGGYEIVKAVVVAASPVKEKEVKAHCSKHLPQGKCPQIVEFMDQLPRNQLGKVEIAKLGNHQ